MPAIIGEDVYGATRAGMNSPQVAHHPALLYVPDSGGSSVTVISQRTRKIVRVLHAGQLSQHVTPSYDLRHLYTNSSAANELVSISPRTARRGGKMRVPRPYNVYFTPDGKQAVVMSEQRNQIRFSDPKSFKLVAARTPPGCRGPNHADFSANGQYFLVTCEFSGAVVKLATRSHRIMGTIRLGRTSMPQDIRISPDGRLFYVAVMGQDRVMMIDGERLRTIGSITTPKEPHGLYPSRNGKVLYVSDRGAGKVSVVSFARRRIVATWTIPGGGSPDMGGVSADGKVLWLTGRYHGVVYGFDTASGRLVAKIRVGGSPHGMAVWPQPGRYSLGHTGNMR
jgi:DNA-binding beta-propeller fold protein YncE